MNHPLTHEIIEKLVQDIYETTDFNDCDECEDNLFARAAADWQLEQVIELWEELFNSPNMTDTQVIREFYTRLLEMRPQEDS